MVNTGEENISGLEGIATETIQNMGQKEKTKKKMCMGTVISVTVSQSNTCAVVSERKGREHQNI